MLAAVDELPATDGITALTEISRRAHDAITTRIRRLKRAAERGQHHNDTYHNPDESEH